MRIRRSTGFIVLSLFTAFFLAACGGGGGGGAAAPRRSGSDVTTAGASADHRGQRGPERDRKPQRAGNHVLVRVGNGFDPGDVLTTPHSQIGGFRNAERRRDRHDYPADPGTPLLLPAGGLQFGGDDQGIDRNFTPHRPWILRPS